MRSFFTLILLIATTSLFSQVVHVGSSLKQLLNDPDAEFHQVDIVLTGKVDPLELKKQFKLNNTPLAQRQKTVIRELLQAAELSQVPFLNDLQAKYTGQFKEVRRFWICNMITLEATPELLNELVKRPEIEFIDLSNARMTKPLDPIIRGEENFSRSPNGIEPGLAAINAPALWAMGYTGRGRLGHSVDTGVWPDHPAISENWMGNHMPLDHCWYWYDTQFPGDKNGAHGTHTVGTTMGLDRATNDTIGVAFNAHFIAADPVATSINTVIPLIEFLPAFQFALNPDGDTSTVSDIPDVINNSWGFTVVSDTTLCTGYFADMLNAIEAAGIANVASAGNDGPGDSTMTYPFHVNTGLVNSFTVGAVSIGSQPYTIAGFSSRGPTTCGGTGSLVIKPEVVAPGVNVRSAVENGGYDSYQGTSMAGPHVSGAVLLLKEAFPYLTGEDILLALYYSAHDLGPLGEDNTYGMGMIDVLAAYDYLAQSHNPIPPHSSPYDLAVSDIQNPDFSLTCTNSFVPEITLSNNGDSAITSAEITYGLVGGAEYNQAWTGNLQSGETTNVTLQSISLNQSANYEFRAKVKVNGNITELDSINNSRIKRFNYRSVETLPFIDNFEHEEIAYSQWYTINPNYNFTWDTLHTSGLDWGNSSLYMRFFNQVPTNQFDELVSPQIATMNNGDLKLKFDYSYQFRHQVYADSLAAFISDDCGDTWTRVFYSGGEAMNTVEEDNPAQGFIPTLPEHWGDTIVDISSYATGGEILVKFWGKSKRGNNMVLDNIKVYSGEEPAAVPDMQETILKVYPNPFSNALTIEFNEPYSRNIDLSLYDMLGKQIWSESFEAYYGKKQVTLSDNNSGIYLLRWCNESGCKSIKVIKN